jgi:hypothetical protein
VTSRTFDPAREDSNWLTFDKELGTLPGERSFWLRDRYFWSVILMRVGAHPFDTAIIVTPGWGGEVNYNQKGLLTISVGVACALFNAYVEQMGFRPTAAEASQFRVSDIYVLYKLYDNWGIAKEPWLFGIVLVSAIRFKFNSLLDFMTNRLDRDDFFGGRFLDEVKEFANSPKHIPGKKRVKLLKTIEKDGPVATCRYVGGTSINVTNSSGITIASNSPGSSQSAVAMLTDAVQQHLLNLANYLEQTAEQLGLTAERAVLVPDLINELRAVANEPAADRSKLARLLETMRLLAVGAASVPLGAGLEALISQAAHALGL